ncbi:MAG: hypothetical protein FJ272_22680 [Planctomycetes bacterium]|nr:hypothetical protein [Planctomycetota bacterium]
MLNDWNLPRTGFETLNGVLSEDELNRVIEGKVDFEEFLGRYLRWCRESRKPVVTTIVCIPRTLNANPWRWAKMPREQVKAEREKARIEDEQTMRFGLATTLMGDGYFAYDGSRGDWWWYKEYDAPLGYPKGPSRLNPDGTWQRDYDGGTVVVNGTIYDAIIQLPRKCRDLSTGRVGTRFTLPMHDGRIFLPTDEPATAGEDMAPRLTAAPPSKLRLARLDAGTTVVQTPGGLDLRFEPKGALQQILWRGRTLMNGGFPLVASPPWTNFHPENVTSEQTATDAEARLTFRGALVVGSKPRSDSEVASPHGTSLRSVPDYQQADFVETVTVRPDNRFTLHFDFTAATDLNLRIWRHYFVFPVGQYAGATVRADGQPLTLPAALGEERLVSSAKQLLVEAKHATVSIESSLPLSLVDHRKWGSEDYLLAGYPVSGAVKQGTKWSVETAVTVSAGSAQ